MTSPPSNVVPNGSGEIASTDTVMSPPYSEQQKDAVSLELQKITSCDVFVSSPASQRLLRFLVSQDLAGESASLKESYIGHVHYGRKAGYDTKQDALVRVNVKRLRALLETYYASSGDHCLRIELPKGSYIPRYFTVPVAENWPKGSVESTECQTFPPSAAEKFAEEGKSSDCVPPAVLSPEGGVPHQRGRIHVSVMAVCAMLITLSVCFLIWQKTSTRTTEDGWTAHQLLHPDGLAVFPNWSPQGDAIAFVSSLDASPSDNSRIVIKNMRTGALTELDTGQDPSTRPAWSPSGLQLAYVTTVGGVKQIRIFSYRDHTQRTVATLSGSYPWLCKVPHLAWTKDETHILTTDQLNPGEACSIVSLDVATGSRQRLTQPPSGVIADVEPMISRDGRQIAFLRNTGTLVGDIYSMNLDGTNLHRVTWENRDIMGFCWDWDDNHFILASRRDDGVLRLWETVQKGRFVRLTDGLTSVGFPVLSPDGDTILFSAYHHSSTIWRALIKDGQAERIIVNDSVNADPVFSPDGRQIAFRSDASGSTEIWLADADGKHSRPVTSLGGPFVDHLAWSPDGKELAFDCRDSGHTSICIMSAQGGPVRHPISWASDEEMPSFPSDGKSLLFTSDRSGSSEIYALKLQTEPATILPIGPGIRGAQVPNQNTVVLARPQPESGLYAQQVVSLTDSRDPQRMSFVLPIGQEQLRDTWEPAPGGIWFLGEKSGDGVSKLFALSIPRKAVSPVLTFKHPLAKGEQAFSVAPDGQSALLVEEGTETAGLDVLRRTRAH